MAAAAEFPQSFEILEMIFMHLPGELKMLRMINQRFNQVIINSVPLMKRCQLDWNNKSEQLFRSTGHKFCKVRFSRCIWKKDVPRMLQFVRQHHLTLRKIECDFDGLEADQFHEILSLVAGTVTDFAWLSKLPNNNVEYPRLVLPELESLTLIQTAVNFFEEIQIFLCRN